MGKKTAERLSPNWAVFNQHSNKAGDRAMALLKEFTPDWAEEVETAEAEGNGIMAIFNEPPTPATAAYSMLVTAFVNEKRSKGK